MSRSRVLLSIIAILIVVGVVTATGFAATGRAVAAAPSSSVVRVVDTLFGNGQAGAAQPIRSTAANTPTLASNTASAAPVTIDVQPGADSESQILEAIYQKVNPSVVQVINLAQSTSRFGRSTAAVPQGEGSGFIWDTQGDIVTNDHVVQGADQLQVIFADGTQVDAKLVGTDPNGDIAVIRVDPSLATLTPVDAGDINQVKVGDLAVAIGNPFGFQGTMTRGIVSALGRSIPSQTVYSIPEAIQTDAAINPGNSGGPLLNASGQVIGVNDQIQSASGSNSGVGFAIPINLVQKIVPSLIKSGQYQHPYLGLSGATYTRAWAQALGFSANTKGVYVFDVAQGGPAQQAGLKGGAQDTSVVLGAGATGAQYLQSGGDLITAVNGKALTSMDDLLIYLEENTTPGQTVQFTVLQANGQQRTVSVTLGVRPNTTDNSQQG